MTQVHDQPPAGGCAVCGKTEGLALFHGAWLCAACHVSDVIDGATPEDDLGAELAAKYLRKQSDEMSTQHPFAAYRAGFQAGWEECQQAVRNDLLRYYEAIEAK